MFDGPDGNEQLLREIEAVAGPQMRPTAAADALLALAIERRIGAVVRGMYTHLRSDLKDWEDEEVARLLSLFLRLEVRKSRLLGNSSEIGGRKKHGVRPGCFGLAAKVLIAVGPWEIAGLARANAVSRWPGHAADADIPRVLAEIYDDPRCAPHRLELLRVLRGASEALKQAFRDALAASEDRSPEARAAIEGLLVGEEIDETVFASDLARTFLTSDESVREALLLHPVDERLGFLRPSFVRCIRLVDHLLQERRREVIRSREYTVIPQFPAAAVEELEAALSRPALAARGAGAPEVLGGEAYDAGPHVAAYSIPLMVRGDAGPTEERMLIHRLGDRFRLGTWGVTSAARAVPLAPAATRALSEWQPAFPECVRSWRQLIDQVLADNAGASMIQISSALRERFCDYPGDWMVDRESIAGLDPSSRLHASDFLLDVLRHTVALPSREQPTRRPVYQAAIEALARIADPVRAAEIVQAMSSEKLEGRQCTGKSFPRPMEILRATAARSGCTCGVGRSGNPREHRDIVVEGTRTTSEGDAMVYEVRFDCRCTGCGSKWRAIESVDWERRSVFWTQEPASRQ